LCCDSGEGWYRVTSGDIVIRDSDGQFGDVNATHYVVPVDVSVDLGSRVLTAPLLMWTTLVPVGKKTAIPTVSLVTKFPTETLVTAPTQSPVTPSTSPTSGPTKTPTRSVVIGNYSFPTLSQTYVGGDDKGKENDKNKAAKGEPVKLREVFD